MKDFSTFRTSLHESAEPLEEHAGSMMPPNILILRRKSVRQFPDHTMVALYYNDKLDQYFSIPYGGDADDVITPGSLKEETLSEDAISHLTRVKNFETNTSLKHKDGTQTKVDPTTASMLLTVHDALHPTNRQKFADHLEASKAKFHKMVDFGWKQVK